MTLDERKIRHEALRAFCLFLLNNLGIESAREVLVALYLIGLN